MTPKSFESEVLERLARIEEHQKGRESRCEEHTSKVAQIRKELDGNGKPGIKKELSDLRQDFKIYESKMETRILIWGSVAFALGSVVIPLGIQIGLKKLGLI